MVLRPGREPDDEEWASIIRMLPWILIALGVFGLGLFVVGIWQESWSKSMTGLALTIPIIAHFGLFKFFKKTMNNHSS